MNIEKYPDLENKNDEDLILYIKDLKKKLGDKIFIPVHHYQAESIVRLGDVVGDSYKLAVESSKTNAEFIIFCGVRFMAEGARILAKDNQKILLPDITAGCPMAEMADSEQVKKIYELIQEECGGDIAVVLYINSYADLKSFCGEKNGSICTSSNAEKIIKYFLNQGEKILFLPDYYLGVNTCLKMGIDEKYIAKINKDLTIDADCDLKEVKIFLWNGFCPIHQRFSVHEIDFLRTKYPEIKIIVHPESPEDVVRSSDYSGSTEKIYNTVKDSPEGSVWGVGTETTFVERLARENMNKTVLPLSASPCKNMMKTTLTKLAVSLKSVDDYIQKKNNKLIYEVEVYSEYKENAKKALKKMIEIAEM
jgi:quinolinate synthase